MGVGGVTVAARPGAAGGWWASGGGGEGSEGSGPAASGPSTGGVEVLAEAQARRNVHPRIRQDFMRFDSSFGAHRPTTHGTAPTCSSLLPVGGPPLPIFSSKAPSTPSAMLCPVMLRRRFLSLLGLAACNRSATRTKLMAQTQQTPPTRMPVLFI